MSIGFALSLLIQGAAPTARAQDPGRADEATLGRIQAQIGPARCQADSECRVLGLGASPCGGPEHFLAWSTLATDADALQKLAARYSEERKRVHERVGMSGICMLLPEPGVRCAKEGKDTMERCVLLPAAGGSPLVR